MENYGNHNKAQREKQGRKDRLASTAPYHIRSKEERAKTKRRRISDTMKRIANIMSTPVKAAFNYLVPSPPKVKPLPDIVPIDLAKELQEMEKIQVVEEVSANEDVHYPEVEEIMAPMDLEELGTPNESNSTPAATAPTPELPSQPEEKFGYPEVEEIVESEKSHQTDGPMNLAELGTPSESSRTPAATAPTLEPPSQQKVQDIKYREEDTVESEKSHQTDGPMHIAELGTPSESSSTPAAIAPTSEPPSQPKRMRLSHFYYSKEPFLFTTKVDEPWQPRKRTFKIPIVTRRYYGAGAGSRPPLPPSGPPRWRTQGINLALLRPKVPPPTTSASIPAPPPVVTPPEAPDAPWAPKNINPGKRRKLETTVKEAQKIVSAPTQTVLDLISESIVTPPSSSASVPAPVISNPTKTVLDIISESIIPPPTSSASVPAPPPVVTPTAPDVTWAPEAGKKRKLQSTEDQADEVGLDALHIDEDTLNATIKEFNQFREGDGKDKMEVCSEVIKEFDDFIEGDGKNMIAAYAFAEV